MKLLLFLLFITNSFCAFAQEKNAHDYGNVSKEELKMKKYEDDSSVGAVCLYKAGYLNANEGYLSIHIRIKILKASGFNQANISIPYYDNCQMNGLKAETVWIDGNDSIHKVELNKNQFYYSRFNNNSFQVAFSFSNVVIGSVIEYQYSLSFIRHSFWDILLFPHWYFQSEIPTVFSLYSTESGLVVSIMKGIDVNTDKAKRFITTGIHGSKISTFVMENIPAWISEPFCSSQEDYIDKVDFYPGLYSVVDTWEKGSEYMLDDDDFGRRQTHSDYLSQKSFTSIENAHATTPYQKMIAIRNAVAAKMNWNGTYSMFCTKDLYQVYDNGGGNSGEINWVLINMLSDKGLNVQPAIISTRSHGQPYTALKNFGQFNHVLAVVTIDSSQYVLDATEKLPWNMLPFECIDRDAIILDSKKARTVYLASSTDFSTSSTFTTNIKSDGTMSGKADFIFDGYARAAETKKYLATSKEEYRKKNYSSVDLKIDSFQIENLDADSLPLETKIYFTKKQNDESDEAALKFVNPFYGLTPPNYFVAEKRLTDIDFGYRQSFEYKALVRIPSNFSIDELPKATQFFSADSSMSFSRVVMKADDAVRIVCNVSIYHKKYLVNEYAEVKKFYVSMTKSLNDVVVLKKIKTTNDANKK